MPPDRAHDAFARSPRESAVASHGLGETRGMVMPLTWAIAVARSV